jgi:ABC-2 type transport system ATP-binding protein
VIQTKGLTKRFDGILAVDALNLEVREGEVFAFLGPNGAGKTTTVRMLSCLIAPTSGEAYIGGFRVGKDDVKIRNIVGILTESPGLYERLSAERNLDFFARLYGVPDNVREKQVKRYLEMLELWDRRHETVGEFSKGMKQKLAIARALLHEPKVLFLDEPTSALDPEMAKVVHDFIDELRHEGRTIFVCTHNLDEADRLADRIGIIKQRLIAVDTPENLRQHLYGRRVVVHLRTVGEPLIAAVRSLPFVNGVQREDNRLIVALDNPDEQNPALVRALVNAGADIQFVGEQRHSLEEVYFSLINAQKREGA